MHVDIESIRRRIDAEVQRIIDESHAEAKRLLVAYRKELDALVAALLERDTLDEEEILEVTGLRPVQTADERRSQTAGAI